MAILNQSQLSIIAKLRTGPRSRSELTTLAMKEMAKRAEEAEAFLAEQLGAIEAAGVPLNITPKRIKLKENDLLLNRNEIYSRLTDKSQAVISYADLHILATVASTNDEIKNYAAPCVLLAEQQEKGKGRYGRSWTSPFAAGIYMSLRLPLARTCQDVGGLSLVAGVTIAKVLTPIEVQLKWPNDLMVAGCKLGGILIELEETSLVVGVGINYNRLAGETCLIQFGQYSRNLLVAGLINQLLENITIFFAYGFVSFRQDWQQRDMLKGRRITVKNGETVEGLCEGIDEGGALLVRTDGGIRQLRSGTLRD